MKERKVSKEPAMASMLGPCPMRMVRITLLLITLSAFVSDGPDSGVSDGCRKTSTKPM